MKFSLIYEAQTADASRAGDRTVLHDMVEQCMLAEQMGFDTIWCVEHTALTNYAHMSAPETFLAFLAGRTTRIGLGHGVLSLQAELAGERNLLRDLEPIARIDLIGAERRRRERARDPGIVPRRDLRNAFHGGLPGGGHLRQRRIARSTRSTRVCSESVLLSAAGTSA